MAKRIRIVSLEEFAKSNPVLECLQDPNCEVPDIVNEIIERTGASYEEVGKFIDLSAGHVGRVSRRDATYIDARPLEQLIQRFNLPRHVIYINARSEHAAKADGPLPPPPLATTPAGIKVYVSVRIPRAQFKTIKSFSDLLSALETRGAAGVETLSDLAVRPRQNRFFVEQVGRHMVSEADVRKTIPQGAALEVEWLPQHEYRTGDVVFVQIKDDQAATAYNYTIDRGSSGVYEVFAPANGGTFPSRVCTATREAGFASLASQRLILGRVIRIVNFPIAK